MNTFIFENWHGWHNPMWNNKTPQFILSDESIKELYYFKDVDDAINWLYLNDNKPAARALNEFKHNKA